VSIGNPARFWLMRAWQVTMAALAPGWRWMAVIAGGGLLYAATDAIGYGHGRLAWWQGPVGVTCGAAAFGALWLATRANLPGWLAMLWKRLPGFARWRVWRAAIVLSLLWMPIYGLTHEIGDAVRGQYHNDAIAYIHLDADLVRQGINPYTDDVAFWQAARRWPLTGATPLLGSVAFGSDPLHYPSTKEQEAVLAQDLTTEHANGAFDPQTAHNYPAGIIWLALPFVWIGLPSVIWLNLLALAALAALVLARAPAEQRAAALVALAACPVLWLYTLLENFDVVCLACVLAAWALADHPRRSAIVLGLACAVKQIAWFFIPFYLVGIARRQGWAAAARRGAWSAASFVVLNMPFLIASPGAWLRGLLVPQADPLFPIGYGLISLGLSGVVPLVSSHLWTALEFAAWSALVLWQWRARSARMEDGLLLALIPLWLAWRSPMNYFALIPALALWIVATRARTASQADHATPPADSPDPAALELAAPSM
jgi:hypothetical protein